MQTPATPAPKPGETLTLNGIAYLVISRDTAEDYDAMGYHNIAAMLREYREEARLALRRPKGTRIHYCREAIRTAAGQTDRIFFGLMAIA